MAAANRANLITKLHQALKKNYKLPPDPPDRSLMETVLFACLLEDAPQEAAEEGLAKLEQAYFDWNEVRVTTVTELADQLRMLPYPKDAAARLKKNLHALFETYYSFDIDDLQKQNLGKALKIFEQLPAKTPFLIAYVTQHGLGGHAIPVDHAAINLMYDCGIVNESERDTLKVPGLERAIPKAKGVEFGALLHQAAVAYHKNHSDTTARKVVSAVNPQAFKKTASKSTKKAASKSTSKKVKPKKSSSKKSTKKKSAGKATASARPKAKTTAKKKSVAKKASPGKSSTKKLSKRKPR